MRACIRLLFDRKQADPLNDETVAKVLKCHRNTVGNVRHRFVVADVAAALYEKPLPPQAPRKLTGEVEAHLIALACSAPLAGRQRRALRFLAGQWNSGWSAYQSYGCRRTAKKNALKPWQVKSWCIPKVSAQFVAKREDVREVYQRPYDAKRLNISLNEARKKRHSTPRGGVPQQPRQPARLYRPVVPPPVPPLHHASVSRAVSAAAPLSPN
jgi:hypothetical protein